jgi:succinate dehydrogenase hydrophobic anchor subunit
LGHSREEEEVTHSDQPSVSSLRAILAACSLTGALVVPVAILHNWPWFQLPSGAEEWYPFAESGYRTARMAAPFEALLGAILATYAAIRIVPRGRREGSQGLVLTVGSALLAGAATGYTGIALMLWMDRLQATGVPPVWFWNGWFIVMFLLTGALLGTSHLVGLPCLAVPRLARAGALSTAVGAAWVAVAAIGGAAAMAWVVPDYLERTGLGFWGSGVMVLFCGVYFTLGTGVAAYYVHRWLMCRAAAKQP